MPQFGKPVIFETTTLLRFVVLGLLGFWIGSLSGLFVVPPMPYNYLGIIPLLAGLVLRFWASSTIFSLGKGTPVYHRPTKVLVTAGRYRLIRNPLYLGSFLICLGIILTIPSIFLAILGLAGLPITYIGIGREEKGLECRFGEDYCRFKQSVPRWIPRIARSSPS